MQTVQIQREQVTELLLQSLGLAAVLPPPEETEHVTTAIEAAKVKKASLETRQ